MASFVASEIQSLEDIRYKSKIKFYIYPFLLSAMFVSGFMNFYPIGEQLKTIIKKTTKGTACNPDYDKLRIEWFMPKVVVTDLVLPSSCLGKVGDPLKFSHLTINFQFITFSPFGIPFKIETEMNGQPLTAYFVQGISSRLVRIKDQPIVLARLTPLLGEAFKINGSMLVDVNAQIDNKNMLKSFALKAQSKDFQLPPQEVQGFTTPSMKLNVFHLEANAEAPPRVSIDKLILGDNDSPMRATLKGKIDLREGNAAFSPIDIAGEVAFSEAFKTSNPIVDALFGTFTQKDGMYQVRMGGTLGQPTPIAQ